jgi:hypothetical protein
VLDQDRVEDRERYDELDRYPQRVEVINAAPPMQAFTCMSCGHILTSAPTRLPMFDDCGAECAIAPVLLCRDRPVEGDEG